MADDVKRGQLTVTRRVGERVVIICPDGTELRVGARPLTQVQTRITISAPLTYRIEREECLEEVDDV